MANALFSLLIDIQASTAAFQQDMAKAVQIAENSVGKIEKLGNSIKNTFMTFGAGFAFQQIVQEAMQAEQAMKQLEAVIRSTGGAAGFTAPEIAKMADNLSRATGIDDDLIVSMNSILLTFTKIGREVLPEANQAIIDFSVRMGIDLKSAAIQVGKALNDPIKGITALRKAGVSFSESQQEMIKHLVNTNHGLEAQKMVLSELKTEFGGAAAAARDTLGGSITQLQTNFGNLLQKIGESQTGGLRFAIEALSKGITQLTDNSGPLIRVFEGVAAAAGILLGLKIPGYFIEITKTVGAAWAAMKLNPLAMLGGQFAVATGLIVAFRDQTIVAGEAVINIGAIGVGVFDTLIQVIGKAVNVMMAMLDTLRGQLQSVADSVASVAAAFGSGDFSKITQMKNPLESAYDLGVNLTKDYMAGIRGPVDSFFAGVQKDMDKLRAEAEKFKGAFSGGPPVGGGGHAKKGAAAKMDKSFLFDADVLAAKVEDRWIKDVLETRKRLGQEMEKQLETQKRIEESNIKEASHADEFLNNVRDANQELMFKIKHQEDFIPLIRQQAEIEQKIREFTAVGDQAKADMWKGKQEELRGLMIIQRNLTQELADQKTSLDAVTESTAKLSVKQEQLKSLYLDHTITMEQYKDALKGLSQPLNDTAKSIGDNIVTAFDKAIFSGEKFTDVLDGLLKAFLRIAEQKIILEPLSKLLDVGIGKITSGFSAGGAGSGIMGSIMKHLPKFASGGHMKAGQPGIVGDGGQPEVFIPGASGNVYPLALAGAGGGGGGRGSNVNVYISNNSKAQITSQERTGPDGMKELFLLIEDRVADNVRRGGSIFRAMRDVTGVSRVGIPRG